MEFLKPVEIGFRRFVLRLLGLFVRRGRPLPASLDFSNKKYLFVRQDRIGDVLVSTPLLHALKSRYPHATVDFLLSSNNHFVLANEPLVRKRWIYQKNLSSGWDVLRSIRQEHYDFVIDLMDNPSATSTVFCAFAGGAWNVGLSKENAYTYDVVVPLLSRKEVHIIDRLAMLLTVFGIDLKTVELRVHYNVLQENKESASRFFVEHGLSARQVIGINVSPGEGTRFWGEKNYQALIRSLRATQKEHPVLVLYQPADQPVAKRIVGSFDDVLLSPETRTFDEFAGFVEKLWLLITPDTSVVHLAAAFQIPSVVLYVQSDKSLRIWQPYGSLSETVVTDVDDLRTIPQQDVFSAVNRLIENVHAIPDRTGHSISTPS